MDYNPPVVLSSWLGSLEHSHRKVSEEIQSERLDILVNYSGGPPLARAATVDEDAWNTAVQRSLLFYARKSGEAIPHMKR